MNARPCRVRPAPGVTADRYQVPRAAAPTDLQLDGNEGPLPADLVAAVDREALRQYPDAGPLEAALAARLGRDPAEVLVSAGADDALDRCCRALLAPGRTLVMPMPGFSMVPRYARLAGAEVVTVPWTEAAYPTDAVLAAIDDRTAMIVVTHPNNPTGGVACAEDLLRLSAAAPEALLVVDLAYVEFADTDLTEVALSLPNAVVMRTFSKAWGLAGLRVGYAAGPAEVIGWLRACGAPYAVSGPSLAMAAAALKAGPDGGYVARVRAERAALSRALTAANALPWPSQGNFLFATKAARAPEAALADPTAAWSGWIRDGMAGLGIAIRAFPGRQDAVRITCPGDDAALARVTAGLGATLTPEALLFDMDGVLVDVSGSYRAAIVQTAASYGVTLTPADIQAAKAAGDANNDWVLTHRLVTARGVEASLDEVTARFEARYQGTGDTPGLRAEERLLTTRAFLEGLGLPLAVVTGRPRSDAMRTLDEAGMNGVFEVLVCMEDGPAKPDPAPVRTALARLGVSRAWLVGDTPDDLRAARAAGVVPLGIEAPGDPSAPTLYATGAARVLDDLTDLSSLLEVIR